jgi:hypothetical protein
MAGVKSRRRKPIRRTRVASQTTIKISGGSDGGALARRVYEAAVIIADAAKGDAAGYPSVQIPESIHVGQGAANTATIYADSPNARPIALGLRHPLFGNRNYWYPMKQRRFLENGAIEALDDAAAVFAQVCDDWAIQKGFS